MHDIVEPGLYFGEQRDRSLLSRPQPLLIGETLDLPLDAEEFLVERQRLVGSARALQQIAASTKRRRACTLRATSVIYPVR